MINEIQSDRDAHNRNVQMVNFTSPDESYEEHHEKRSHELSRRRLELNGREYLLKDEHDHQIKTRELKAIGEKRDQVDKEFSAHSQALSHYYKNIKYKDILKHTTHR